jgi:hypothetical protein
MTDDVPEFKPGPKTRAACAKLFERLDDEDIEQLKKLIMYLCQLSEAKKRGARSRDDTRAAVDTAIAEFERTTGVSFVELDRPVCDLLDGSSEDARKATN